MSDPVELPEIDWYLVRDTFAGPANGREGYSLGQLFFERGGERVCYTVEDEDRHLEDGNGHKVSGTSAMPLGRYQLTLYPSPRHGLVPLFHDVPGFKYTEMHKGNDAEDLLGCVALGEQRTADGVAVCAPALRIVVVALHRLVQAGHRVFCNIERS